ncbi:MAG: putative hydroxymethylpyrimidine transporter CytX [Bacillota bacterium]|nr:putative hydroxymethylpyrimidine transporter CytX [Bacillota bacterium]
MKLPKTLSHGLLWFGAAVSLAEMMTGTLFAPLGWGKGVAAVLLGHAIGCVLLYLIGLIGAETKEPTMKSSRIAFGRYGSYAFSIFNIVQLLGWTAIMIIGGSAVLRQTVSLLAGYENSALWTILIGVLVGVWIIAGMKNVGKINVFAVGGLFVLTIIMSFVVFGSGEMKAIEGSLTFGAAVELSIAMPLSWLPLIGDYTRDSNQPKRTAAISAVTYFIGSVWMYVIGMALALYAGESDIGIVLAAAGFGVVALLVALFSTVTTTFLDAYSAGVSFTNLSDGKGEKTFALIVCAVATVLALLFPMDQYENFLYLIGSFFVPMVTLLLMEYFVFQQRSMEAVFRWDNAMLWAMGFGLYRVFLSIDTVVGSTVPVMVILAILSAVCHGAKTAIKKS